MRGCLHPSNATPLDPPVPASYITPMPKRNLRLLRLARAMRADPTSAGGILWEQLRGGQPGRRCRRQEPIGPYIADFVCKARRLVVEVDGDTHENPAADLARDRDLRAMGYRVLRFHNSEIYEHRDAMVDYIWHRLHPEDRD